MREGLLALAPLVRAPRTARLGLADLAAVVRPRRPAAPSAARHRPRTLLSLFDFSGAWAEPFERGGWNVIQIDIKHGDDIRDFSATWLFEHILQGFVVDGVVASPPCTDFARSGATHWREKDHDGRTAESVHLVYQTLRTIDALRPDFWAIENPVGRIANLVPELGKPRCSFDPCDYAGWNPLTPADLARLRALRARAPGSYFSPDEVTFVRETNAYTKRTMLWGRFTCPEQRRVEPVKTTVQGSWLQALGGKSARTKELRSLTPMGFARAFYEANKDALSLEETAA